MKRIVAITGGIGAGKSVVCRVLKGLGYPVYDCDLEAKALMDSDEQIKQRIAAEVTPKAFLPDGKLDRKAISQCVFSSSEKLSKLNAIVHSAVRKHFAEWVDAHTSPTLFVETAILYESGFNKLVNEVWEVTAPADVRIERVRRRSGLSNDEIAQRMASQTTDTHPHHRIIVNDDLHPLLPQILSLL